MTTGRRIRAAAEALGVLAMAAMIVLPALPGAWEVPLAAALRDLGEPIGLSQRWAMYAPDPQRSLAYLSVRGRFADGREEGLAEDDALATAWGTTWAWKKRRHEIWRFYAALSKQKGGDHRRTWYVKSICVREARERVDPPQILLIDRVVRSFTPPAKVREGADEFGPVIRTPVQKINCGYPPIQRMIQEDRIRRGQGEPQP